MKIKQQCIIASNVDLRNYKAKTIMYNTTLNVFGFSIPVSTWLQRMMLQYPFIELFVRSRDIDMMIHAIKLLNNYTVKSSVGSRKVYNLTIYDICKYDVDTYMALSYRFNFDIINIDIYIYTEISNA